MKFKFLLTVLCLSLFITACEKEDDGDSCDTSNVTYTNTVADILNNSCATAGCHVTGNEMNAFFSLEGYANAAASAGFGRMVGSIKHEEGFSPMPKGGQKLDDCDINKIAQWVEDGAPE